MTIPNVISLIRIALVPVLVWLLAGRDDPTAAGILLGVIGSTDWIDGYLARRLDQVSELGKFLDPLADRLAVAAAVITGWITGHLPWPLAAAIAVREAVVGIGAIVLGIKARAKLEVRPTGKLATMLLYFAVPAFFLHSGTGAAGWEVAAWALAVPGLILYYAVGVLYFGDMRRVVTSGGARVSSGSGEERAP